MTPVHNNNNLALYFIAKQAFTYHSSGLVRAIGPVCVCLCVPTVTFELDDSKTTGYLDIWHAGSSQHYLGQVLGHRSRFTVRG